MKTLIKILTYTPHFLLMLTYGWHGVFNLAGGEEYRRIVSSLGIDPTITTWLLIFTGLLDCFIAVLLVAKHRLLPKLPWNWLFAYVGLWPIIPRLIEWNSSGRFVWIETLIFAMVALMAAYNMRVRVSSRKA